MMFNCLVHGLSNGYECKECHEVKMIGSQAQYKRFFGNKEQPAQLHCDNPACAVFVHLIIN